ncbi:MAG: class I SAM-dependent methyltransferase [Methanobacteriaceae archaeon]
MKGVKDHFQKEAEIFDGLIRTLIPHYQEMIEALAEVLPFHPKEHVSVLDLGSGTGNVSLTIKKRFPQAHITCLDLAENMIQNTRYKLAEYTEVDYVVGDLRDLEAVAEYDAVVSSLAIHHLSRKEQQSLYPKIHTALKEGGVFYNADNLKASSEHLNQFYLKKWKEFLFQHHHPDEVEEVWLARHYREDHPQSLEDHLNWLKESGFRDVDVVWKHYYFGVYGGRK